eukprot:tig00000144_g9139.t1
MVLTCDKARHGHPGITACCPRHAPLPRTAYETTNQDTYRWIQPRKPVQPADPVRLSTTRPHSHHHRDRAAVADVAENLRRLGEKTSARPTRRASPAPSSLARPAAAPRPASAPRASSAGPATRRSVSRTVAVQYEPAAATVAPEPMASQPAVELAAADEGPAPAPPVEPAASSGECSHAFAERWPRPAQYGYYAPVFASEYRSSFTPRPASASLSATRIRSEVDSRYSHLRGSGVLVRADAECSNLLAGPPPSRAADRPGAVSRSSSGDPLATLRRELMATGWRPGASRRW